MKRGIAKALIATTITAIFASCIISNNQTRVMPTTALTIGGPQSMDDSAIATILEVKEDE